MGVTRCIHLREVLRQAELRPRALLHYPVESRGVSKPRLDHGSIVASEAFFIEIWRQWILKVSNVVIAMLPPRQVSYGSPYGFTLSMRRALLGLNLVVKLTDSLE